MKSCGHSTIGVMVVGCAAWLIGSTADLNAGAAAAATAPSQVPASIERLPVAKPDRQHPVTARAILIPDNPRAGETLGLYVKVRIMDGYHVYRFKDSGGENVATSIEFKLPRELVREGDWILPKSTRGVDGTFQYTNTVVFGHRLRWLKDTKVGNPKIPLKLRYQVCNEVVCWPPKVIPLEAIGTAISPK